MGNEINIIIDNLCQKLGTSATFLIPELAKKAIAEDIVGLVLMYVAGRFILKFVQLMKQKAEANDIDLEEVAIFSIFPAIVLLIDFVLFATTAVDLAGWIASPTAKAIKQIASMIK